CAHCVRKTAPSPVDTFRVRRQLFCRQKAERTLPSSKCRRSLTANPSIETFDAHVLSSQARCACYGLAAVTLDGAYAAVPTYRCPGARTCSHVRWRRVGSGQSLRGQVVSDVKANRAVAA